MAKRRRVGFVAAVLACTLIATAAFCWKSGMFGARRTGAAIPVAMDRDAALRAGDITALTALSEEVIPALGAKIQPATEQECETLNQTLQALRKGFLKYEGPARASVVLAACRIFDRYSKEPAPPKWVDALPPLHDILTASMADADPNTRKAALVEIAKLWVWTPGRSIIPVEEQMLAEWKGGMHPGVVRCLSSRDSTVRSAAVACLGALPIDELSAPGLPYLEDPDRQVRKQTLVSYSNRPNVLTVDMLLTRMNDSDPTIQEAASLVLKTRGLSQEQISLGALIFSPKPAQRVSVIPLIKDRSDLDPVVWLIQLSKDSVESVRLAAIEALASHKSPLVERRLAEMARSDVSKVVREAAGKCLPPVENTASLPPLPGSRALNPKAN